MPTDRPDAEQVEVHRRSPQAGDGSAGSDGAETVGAEARGKSRSRRRAWLLLGLGLLYLISPIDILPEALLPGLGFIDDVAILPLLLWLVIRLVTSGR